jgi:hypothetical protein
MADRCAAGGRRRNRGPRGHAGLDRPPIDGALDATRPEALLYEEKNSQMRLVAVEYVVIAEAWHAANEAPPVLMGQLVNHVGAPNRYGIPAFYELHVWAWKHNPNGVFADWNPSVSCADFTGGDGMPQGHH